MCFARVRPTSIGRKAGGVLLTMAAGFVVTVGLAPQTWASAPGGGSSVVSGSVNSTPTIWQCEAVNATSTSTPPPTTPPPTTPPPSSTSEPVADGVGIHQRHIGQRGGLQFSGLVIGHLVAGITHTHTHGRDAARVCLGHPDGQRREQRDPGGPSPSTASPAPSPATLTAFYATPAPTLCISVESLQASIVHGQSAEWAVSAWAVNGDVSSVNLQLTSSNHSLTPEFSFGCGSYDGTASCDLGSVFSGSTARQVIASVAVPASAKDITSVKLTATESAADLTTDPSASVTVPVTSGTASSGSTANSSAAGTGTGSGANGSTVSPLTVGSLPTIGGDGATSSISPGGNAAGLFPTINPSQVPSPASGQGESARPVADSEALPIGTPVIDAQLLGLGALGVAFLLAVTRLSVRRRPAGAMAGGRGAVGPARASAAPTPAEAVKAEPVKAEPVKAEAVTAADITPEYAALGNPAADDATLDDFTLDTPSADTTDTAAAEPSETDDPE